MQLRLIKDVLGVDRSVSAVPIDGQENRKSLKMIGRSKSLLTVFDRIHLLR